MTIPPPAAPDPAAGAPPASFAALGLSPELLRAVERLGWTSPSPIQVAAIPALLGGGDLVGQSHTGSGKTGAFVIPAVARIDPASRATQVLVLVPTRELATQVAEETARLSAFTKGVRTATVFGGASYERQFADLSRGAHIVVGTPGRLVDLLARGALDLSAVSMLVLDEADRMLDMGFAEDVERILAATPPGRQTVFFSATFPPAIQGLVQHHARAPREIRIGAGGGERGPVVEQVFHEVRHHAKRDALGRLIDYHDPPSGLVFCNTQRMVDELADWLLDRGCAVERLHGGMAQAQRSRVMEGFKRGAFRWLVATDVAARGIDVNDLGLVVNYDLPADAEDYLHRVGRTGRAGKGGMAVTLVSGGAGFRLGQIERALGLRIRRAPVPSAAAVATRRMEEVVERLREVLRAPGGAPTSPVVERLLGEGHAPEAIAAAALARYAPLPAAPPFEESIDAPPPRGAPQRRPPPASVGQARTGPGAPRPPGKRRVVATPAGAPGAEGRVPPRHPTPKGARTRRIGPASGGSEAQRSPAAKKPFAKKSWAGKKGAGKKKPGKG